MPPQQHKRSEFTQTKGQSQRLVSSKDHREIGACAVEEVGLQNFIRSIVKEINLNLTEEVLFNLNDRGVLQKWSDVFQIEATYAKCLGISKRLYQCHSYTHEPSNGVSYFVLEEFNKRTWTFLPEFKFYVLVFCWYDKETRSVTKVSVQYDQHSFFLHCLGIEGLWRWTIANILTPPAKYWAKAYFATGFVNPFTFIAQIVLFVWGISKLLS